MSGTKGGESMFREDRLFGNDILTSGKAEQSGRDFCLSQSENYSTLWGMFRDLRN